MEPSVKSRLHGVVSTPWRRKELRSVLGRCLAGLLALSLLPAAACQEAPSAEAEPAEPSPRDGGTFRMAQDAPGSLDPARVDDVYEAAIVNQIFDGLLAFDAHLNVIPGVAESWTISRDGRVYNFDLRPGVRFHDGSVVTAQDFVYSYTRVFELDPEETMLAREYLYHIAGSHEYEVGGASRIVGLEAVSPSRLRITLAEPFASFLAVLAMEQSRVVPQHYVEEVGEEVFGQRPIGCGPFRLRSWQPESRIVLTAFDGYHFGRAHLDSMVFELPDEVPGDYAATRFMQRRLSAAVVPVQRLLEFRNDTHARILSRQELSLSFLAFNTEREPFDDPRVRRAVALALDRSRLGQIEDGAWILPTGILPPGMPGYSPEPKVVPHDLDAARDLLAEAGHPGGAGLPSLEYTTPHRTYETQRVNAEITRQLRELGFKVKTHYVTWAEFDRRLKNKDLQCFTLTWVADIPDPDSMLYPLFHSRGAANYMNYSSREVDELLLAGRRARSAMKRWEIYRDAERRILADAPLVPIYHPMSIIAVQSNVRNLHVTPMGSGNLALELVWLDTREASR